MTYRAATVIGTYVGISPLNNDRGWGEIRLGLQKKRLCTPTLLDNTHTHRHTHTHTHTHTHHTVVQYFPFL